MYGARVSLKGCAARRGLECNTHLNIAAQIYLEAGFVFLHRPKQYQGLPAQFHHTRHRCRGRGKLRSFCQRCPGRAGVHTNMCRRSPTYVGVLIVILGMNKSAAVCAAWLLRNEQMQLCEPKRPRLAEPDSSARLGCYCEDRGLVERTRRDIQLTCSFRTLLWLRWLRWVANRL